MDEQVKIFFEEQKKLEERHRELRKELARVKISTLELDKKQTRPRQAKLDKERLELSRRQEELRVELFNINYQIATLKLVTKRSKE